MSKNYDIPKAHALETMEEMSYRVAMEELAKKGVSSSDLKWRTDENGRQFALITDDKNPSIVLMKIIKPK